MTRAQECILSFIGTQFKPGTIDTFPAAPDSITITDHKGQSLTLSVNLYGDILADKEIIAESNTDHNLTGPAQMPTAWKLIRPIGFIK